jgi:hypothetical protein
MKPSMTSLEEIMARSESDANFKDYCEHKQFDSYWESICIELGHKLANESFKYIVLPEPSSFNQAKGLYFFYCYNTTKDEKNLITAMSAKSPHATQTYNTMLYEKIDHDPSLDLNAKKELFSEIIQNCKKLLNYYGTYSYVMLAEAYIRRSLIDEDHQEGAKTAATECIKKAKYYSEKSQAAIHNAGYGYGLRLSNSQNLSDLDDIEQLLNTIYEHRQNSPSF